MAVHINAKETVLALSRVLGNKRDFIFTKRPLKVIGVWNKRR